MTATERIGVFICECGPNIKDAIDLAALAEFAQGLDQVVVAEPFGLLCSKEGADFLRQAIRTHDLTRVVMAACSPKEHEKTFQRTLSEAGLNPFLLQVVNIREQCAWVTKDKDQATAKAKALLAAAVKRVVHQEPIEVRQIDCRPEVLVIGAGVAGMSAALTLADNDRRVHLVETLPCIGGKVARYEDLYPTLECASCVLDPLMDRVLHHAHVEVLTLTEVEQVLGFYGNFVAKTRKRARYVDQATCIGCGACFDACPVTVKNEYNEGLNDRKAVYIPYPGALPNVAVIDPTHCLRWQGQACTACQESCPFGSIDYGQKDEEMELSVGAIVAATGFDCLDPSGLPQYGYQRGGTVLTALEFERLLNGSGPTQGRLVTTGGDPPGNIAFVYCAGSRTPRVHDHCSGVCCLYTAKFMHQAAKKVDGVSMWAFFADLCLPGKEGQAFFDGIAKSGQVTLVRLQAPDAVEIVQEEGRAVIRYVDYRGEPGRAEADMVVLAPAMEGARGARQVAEVLEIRQGKAGFFEEDHGTLEPVRSTRDGVLIAGCAQGPKGIADSVAQGQAAAGKILAELVPGRKLTLEGATAAVASDLCSGCGVCIQLCPYKAIGPDPAGKGVVVNEVLCRGCGLCAAACPSGAIKARHFSDGEIFAEIEGLLGRGSEG